MHILAAMFDVADDGLDIYDAGLIAGFIASIYLAIRWMGRKGDERIKVVSAQGDESLRKAVEELKRSLHERTEPIQPDANHGKSLPDVHDRLERIETETKVQFARVEQRIDWLADLVVNALTAHNREPQRDIRRRGGETED